MKFLVVVTPLSIYHTFFISKQERLIFLRRLLPPFHCTRAHTFYCSSDRCSSFISQLKTFYRTWYLSSECFVPWNHSSSQLLMQNRWRITLCCRLWMSCVFPLPYFVFNWFSFDEGVCKSEALGGWNALTYFSHVYDDGKKLQLNIKHRGELPTSRLEDEELVAEHMRSDRWFIDVYIR